MNMLKNINFSESFTNIIKKCDSLVYCGDYISAINELDVFIKRTSISKNETYEAYLKLQSYHYNSGNLEESRNICLNVLGSDVKQMSKYYKMKFYLALGSIYLALNVSELSVTYYTYSKELYDELITVLDDNVINDTEFKFKLYNNLILSLLNVSSFDKARDAINIIKKDIDSHISYINQESVMGELIQFYYVLKLSLVCNELSSIITEDILPEEVFKDFLKADDEIYDILKIFNNELLSTMSNRIKWNLGKTLLSYGSISTLNYFINDRFEDMYIPEDYIIENNIKESMIRSEYNITRVVEILDNVSGLFENIKWFYYYYYRMKGWKKVFEMVVNHKVSEDRKILWDDMRKFNELADSMLMNDDDLFSQNAMLDKYKIDLHNQLQNIPDMELSKNIKQTIVNILKNKDTEHNLVLNSYKDVMNGDLELLYLKSHHVNELTSSNIVLENFAYILSHDLKTHVRNIKSFSMLLYDEYINKLDDNGQTYLKMIDDYTSKMILLIESSLAYAQIGKYLNKEKYNIIESIKDAIKISSQSYPDMDKSKIKIKITKDNFPQIYADKSLITNVFTNLINNSLKFNDKDMKIIEIGYREEWMYIKDNGIGMTAQQSVDVFKLFYRVNTGYPGTGLGLSIIKRILQKHGCDIKIVPNNIFMDPDATGITCTFTVPV